MTVWTTELYPTAARSTAMGVMHAFARVGAASSPWIVKGLKRYGDWIPFTVMGVTAVIGALAGVKLRETKNEQLMEVKEMKRRVTRVSTMICGGSVERTHSSLRDDGLSVSNIMEDGGSNVSSRSGSTVTNNSPRMRGLSWFANPIYEMDEVDTEEPIKEDF